ncbi:MAG: hypothetical protein R3F54_28865 [Alphaproteobacteria bacterium]
MNQMEYIGLVGTVLAAAGVVLLLITIAMLGFVIIKGWRSRRYLREAQRLLDRCP